MKTTELFVEQVLVGGLVLLPALLMWPDALTWLGEEDQVARTILGGGALLGAAYVLGIVADRVVDTILERLEHQSRESYEAERGKHKGIAAGAREHEYHESRLRTLLLTNTGLAEHGAYLRSRMRLARALAVTAPAISAAAVGGQLTDPWRWRYAAGILLIYLIVSVVSVWKADERKSWRADHLLLWAFGLLVVLPVVAVFLSVQSSNKWFAIVAVVTMGPILSISSGWAWLRISRTLRRHLDDSYAYVLKASYGTKR